jgi:hypothetical protein
MAKSLPDQENGVRRRRRTDRTQHVIQVVRLIIQVEGRIWRVRRPGARRIDGPGRETGPGQGGGPAR